MEIEYTPHADFNISERKLNKKIIESIIKNPDKVIDSMYGRKVAQKVVNGKLIRVVYRKENGIIIDIGKKGKILSIEILDVSKRMPKESIEDITVGLTI